MKILVLAKYDQYHTVRPEAEIFISLSKLGYDITVMTNIKYKYARIFKDAGIKIVKLDGSVCLISIMAPKTTIPLIALAPDIKGVCSIVGTLDITSKPNIIVNNNK